MNKKPVFIVGPFLFFLCVLVFTPVYAKAASPYAVTIRVKSKKDFTRKMQEALNKAAKKGKSKRPGRVIISNGTYSLKGTLVIGSNTTIQCGKKVKIIKKATNFAYMIRSQIKKKGKYKSIKNVTINGGTWDANYKKYTSDAGGSNMTFVHGENITIKNAKICRNFSSHLIELVGIKNATISNCKLYGFIPSTPTAKKEAIQLDVVHSTKVISNAYPYDDTPCRDITIKNNEIYKYARAIGTHSAVDRLYQDNIRIENNYIHDLSSEGIYCYNFTNVSILNNRIKKVAKAIMIKTDNNENGAAYYNRKSGIKPVILENDAFNYTISGNTLLSKDIAGYSSVSIGVQIFGSSRYPIGNINISNNIISGEFLDLYMKYVCNVKVTDNDFTHDTYRANESSNVIYN